MTGVPAVILAGGLATRMGGGDKGLRPWKEATLLDAIIALLTPQAGPLALNANGDPARFARFGLPVLPDPVPGNPGPLAGVLAAMLWARGLRQERVLTVPCDTPDLPGDLIVRLADGDAGCGAMAAGADGELQPTVALWPVALADSLAAHLTRGGRRMRGFAAGAGLVAVPFAGTSPDPFRNINHPGELE